MKLTELNIAEDQPLNTIMVFRKGFRIVRAVSIIPETQIAKWVFTSDYGNFEYISSALTLKVAADLATKEYCRTKNTKFAQLTVTQQ